MGKIYPDEKNESRLKIFEDMIEGDVDSSDLYTYQRNEPKGLSGSQQLVHIISQWSHAHHALIDALRETLAPQTGSVDHERVDGLAAALVANFNEMYILKSIIETGFETARGLLDEDVSPDPNRNDAYARDDMAMWMKRTGFALKRARGYIQHLRGLPELISRVAQTPPGDGSSATSLAQMIESTVREATAGMMEAQASFDRFNACYDAVTDEQARSVTGPAPQQESPHSNDTAQA
jgi:hypothetical protein